MITIAMMYGVVVAGIAAIGAYFQAHAAWYKGIVICIGASSLVGIFGYVTSHYYGPGWGDGVVYPRVMFVLTVWALSLIAGSGVLLSLILRRFLTRKVLTLLVFFGGMAGITMLVLSL